MLAQWRPDADGPPLSFEVLSIGIIGNGGSGEYWSYGFGPGDGPRPLLESMGVGSLSVEQTLPGLLGREGQLMAKVPREFRCGKIAEISRQKQMGEVGLAAVVRYWLTNVGCGRSSIHKVRK